ncbi:MAG TPA: thioredoxin [Methylomirabilota bacterium]|nr:thioredoxin [Methylomirabilota bacterium]
MNVSRPDDEISCGSAACATRVGLGAGSWSLGVRIQGPEGDIASSKHEAHPSEVETMTETALLHVTEASFDRTVTERRDPMLVDFYADWCPPCRAIAPIVEELAREYAGRVTVAKVNVDEQPGLATRFDVHTIPTLLLFQGGRVVDRVVGAVAKPALRRRLDAIV